MKHKPLFIRIMTLITSLLFVACGSNPLAPATPAPTNTAVPTNTPLPTNTPAPTNTPDPNQQTEPTITPPTELPPTPTELPLETTNTTPKIQAAISYGDTIQGEVTEGSNQAWSFVGTAEDVITLMVEPLADFDATIDILNSTGQSLIDGPIDNSFTAETVENLTLSQNDEYVIVVEGFNGDGGTYTLTLSTAAGTTAVSPSLNTDNTLTYGDTIADEIDESQTTIWRFTGQAGDMIDVIASPDDALDVIIDILNTAGESILENEVDDSFGIEEIRRLTLPSDGDYFIIARGFADTTGAYRLTLQASGDSTVAVTGILSAGDEVIDTIGPGEVDIWTFIGNPGDFVDITAEPITDEFDLVITVSGDVAIDGEAVDAAYNIEFIRALALESEGKYTIAISGFDGSTGEYELRFDQTNNGQVDTIITNAGTIDEEDESHSFPFTAVAGDNVTIIFGPQTNFDMVITIYDDDTDEILQEKDSITSGFEELTFTPPETGNYYFNMSGFEGEMGDYTVRLIGSAETIFELDDEDEVEGRFVTRDNIEYGLRGTEGDTVTITAVPAANLDINVQIVDLNDDPLVNANAGGEGANETVSYTFTSDGIVILQLFDNNESGGTFTFTVDEQ